MKFKFLKAKKQFTVKAISVFMAVIMICSLMPMNSIFCLGKCRRNARV